MTSAHPGLPEFDYVRPNDLAEASQFLAKNASDARAFSGGTDCFVRMRDGFFNPKYMVDVKNLAGTKVLKFDPKEGLTIGAAIPMNQVINFPEAIKQYPLLVDAAKSVASYQLRSRATIIGNICNASPAGDTIGACMAYDGVLNVHGLDGLKTYSLRNFFTGPGKNLLKPGDIVLSITLPVPPAGHTGKYLKLGRNRLSDLSIVGVSVLGYINSALKSGYSFKLAIASVAPVPFVPQKAQEVLEKNELTPEVIEQAAQAAMDSVTPIDDVRGSAQYRKHMVRNLVKRGVTEVLEQLKA